MAAEIPSLSGFAAKNRSALRSRIVEARKTFRNQLQDPGCKEWKDNLDHFMEDDDQFEYNKEWQKGLIPSALVGKKFGSGPFRRSETFFTNYEQHNSESLILSKSDASYIIGNRASHDMRLYSKDCDPMETETDKTAAAGMSYMHLLIIPKQKVYNVVQLEDNEVIKEMIDHFNKFWQRRDAADKVNARIKLAMEEREKEVIKSLEKNLDKKDAFEKTMQDVGRYAESCAAKLKELRVGEEGIVFRFHAGTDASIPHLHMHVLASPAEFRQHSTLVHDRKAIPAAMVMEVIDAERSLPLRIFYLIRDFLQSAGLMKPRIEISTGQAG